jgi:hypothetical protein
MFNFNFYSRKVKKNIKIEFSFEGFLRFVYLPILYSSSFIRTKENGENPFDIKKELGENLLL